MLIYIYSRLRLQALSILSLLLQEALSSLNQTGLSRELDSYSEVCEALKIVELLLGFLTMTGGDPKYPLVAYLRDMLKMADHIDHHILQVIQPLFVWCECECSLNAAG